jgi:hypothetical protein
MCEDANENQKCKITQFFVDLFAKIDKKMADKAKNSSCSCKTNKEKDKSCCS